MQWPNFLIIGAPRSGTTTIYEGLRQHPEIFMSPFKEPWFFALAGKTEPFNGPGDNDPVRTGIRDEDAYLALFNGVKHEKAIGEASTLYLYSPEAAIKIRERLPEVKLIAILRSPVDRAYSNYIQHVQQGRETLPFKDAIEAEEQRESMGWSPFWLYRKMGLYGKQLTNYYHIFSKEQIHIFLYDDIVDNPSELFKSIFKYLEIDTIDTKIILNKQNLSGIPKRRNLHTLLTGLTKSRFTNKFVKPLLPPKIRRNIRLNFITSLINRNLVKTPISEKDRQELTDYYHEDILLTQDITNRDLTNWLTY